MEESSLVFVSIIGGLISLIIYYLIIRGAVASAMNKTNELLEKQNKILLKWLQHQGFETKELDDKKAGG
jgi:hypothetical protein